MNFYILDQQGEPVQTDLNNWALWFETFRDQRCVRQTLFRIGDLRIKVSTVFLGFEHVGGIWETMIFGPDDIGHYQQRYHTRAEAIEGHTAACLFIEVRFWSCREMEPSRRLLVDENGTLASTPPKLTL